MYIFVCYEKVFFIIFIIVFFFFCIKLQKKLLRGVKKRRRQSGLKNYANEANGLFCLRCKTHSIFHDADKTQ